MKKVISALLAVVMAIGFSVSVAADGEEVSSEIKGDFLLRGNSWGIKSTDIVESGKYNGKTDETDASENKWTGENYTAVINGDTYRIRYDFNADGRLFEVSYFGEEIEDEAALNDSYVKLVALIKAEYGEPEEFIDGDEYSYAEWQSGSIVALKLGGYRVQAFYTVPDFNWEKMSFAAGESVLFEEIKVA